MLNLSAKRNSWIHKLLFDRKVCLEGKKREAFLISLETWDILRDYFSVSVIWSPKTDRNQQCTTKQEPAPIYLFLTWNSTCKVGRCLHAQTAQKGAWQCEDASNFKTTPAPSNLTTLPQMQVIAPRQCEKMTPSRHKPPAIWGKH